MTTLVTGAGGFVGSHLAEAFREVGEAPAVGVDRHAFETSGYGATQLVDFADDAAIRGLLRSARPARIVHLIGGALGDEALLRDLNVGTARRLLDSLVSEGIDATTVLLGSAAEYGAVPVDQQPVGEDYIGRPTTPYGVAKRELTQLAVAARDRGLRVTVARPFNIIGPRVPQSLVCGALIARMQMAMRADGPRQITVGRLDGVRDFIAVQDVARGLARLAHHPSPALAYNLCTGIGHPIQLLLDHLLELSGGDISTVHDVALRRGGDVDQMIGDPSRAKHDLAWEPKIAFADAVAQSWAWATSRSEFSR